MEQVQAYHRRILQLQKSHFEAILGKVDRIVTVPRKDLSTHHIDFLRNLWHRQ